MDGYIKTVLIYLEKDNRYLMLYRNKEENDFNGGFYLGVGGHIEDGESPEEALVREVKEETGYDLISYEYRGFISFMFGSLKEDMYVYTSKDFKGVLGETDEGTFMWVDKNDVLKLNLWPSDHYFLERIIGDNNFFEYRFIYDEDKKLKEVTKIS